jgi:DNA repair exonuclease SbcCD ATPase subunit
MRAVTIGLAVLGCVAVLAGCGGTETAKLGSAQPVIRSLDSSWIPGQLSLSQLAAYQAISEPALKLAAERVQQRKRELALLEAQRIAAQKKARDDARRKYLEALRRAREQYRAALRKAARERARQLRLLAAAKRRLERLRREAERKRRVAPGEECRDPELRRVYHCGTGHLPLPPPKHK